ncbi:MAG: sulfite exporter TauE/SafE family protein, partial [Planctomycetes bacterium]|nr:sulfite exporter TauE/SafE family protein [Planctomycetota bacterium]
IAMDCCSHPSVASSLWLVFVGGLLGSGHCLGMCGPLVVLMEGTRAGRWTPWSPLVLHVGRLITYGLLGAAAGLAGGALERTGLAVGLQGAATLLGGGAMVLLALVLLGWLPWRRALNVSEQVVARFAQALASPRPWGKLALGIYWGLLPCGLVWAFMLRAAADGSALGGAAAMLAFGAGTVPALMLAGGLAGLLNARLRALLPRLAAGSVLVLGVLLVLRGAAGAGWIPHLRIAPGLPVF